jgi:hypothetical protein
MNFKAMEGGQFREIPAGLVSSRRKRVRTERNIRPGGVREGGGARVLDRTDHG